MVTDKDKVNHSIELYDIDIEKLILAKAKKMGIEGYNGRILTHYDERIIDVQIRD